MVAGPVGTHRKAQRLLASAETLRAADHVAEAVAELERALTLEGALEPTLSAEIRLRLADCCRQLNDHEAACRQGHEKRPASMAAEGGMKPISIE